MKKRLIALSLCLILVGTLAATTAVSASPPGKDRETTKMVFPLMYGEEKEKVGTLTVCLASGCYNAKAVLGIDTQTGDFYKLVATIKADSAILPDADGNLKSSITYGDWGVSPASTSGRVIWADWYVKYGGGPFPTYVTEALKLSTSVTVEVVPV